MRLLDDFDLERASSFDGRIEVVHLEPEQYPMSMWRRVRIDKIRVILLVPRVELEDQLTITKHPIIAIAMLMLRERVDTEQSFVPAAARAYVADGNQWLRPNAHSRHGFLSVLSHWILLYLKPRRQDA
ncbi:MAG: hypothetical protein WCA22_00025, partial [Candidatus Binatus sp.]